MNGTSRLSTAANRLQHSGKRRKRVLACSALALASIITGVVVACAPLAPIVPAGPATGSAANPSSRPTPNAKTVVRHERAGVLGGRDRTARIALAGGLPSAKISATGAWEIHEQGGRASLVRGEGRETWQVERKGGLLRVTGAGNDATPWREGPFVARASASAIAASCGLPRRTRA